MASEITYNLDVPTKTRGRLELITADTASPLVFIRAVDLMLGKRVAILEVLITLVTVVMELVILLVLLHCRLGLEQRHAVGVGASHILDRLRGRTHLDPSFG